MNLALTAKQNIVHLLCTIASIFTKKKTNEDGTELNKLQLFNISGICFITLLTDIFIDLAIFCSL